MLAAFDAELAPAPFETKMFRIGANEGASFPKHRPAYSINGNGKSWQDGPWPEEGSPTIHDLQETHHVASGGTYNVDTSVVFVPNFTPLSSTGYKSESLMAYGLGTVETGIDLELARIHIGRGKTDANQVAWLSSRPDGFGSPIFHGSPDEFEVLYEKNRANYEAPIGDERKFDSPAPEFTPEQKTASGWSSWFAYMAAWHTPRLRQIRGGDILVDITYESSYHKVLRFYWAAALGTKTGDFYMNLGTPFKVVDLSNPTAPQTGAGLPTTKNKLRIGEDGKRYHEVILTETRNPLTQELQTKTVSIKLSEDASATVTHRHVDATLTYAQGTATTDTWAITDTVGGVVTNITETYAYGFSPRDTDNPVLKSRTVTAGSETRGFTLEWDEPDPEEQKFYRRDYRLKKIVLSGSATWASNGFEYHYRGRGIPSLKKEMIGGKVLETVCSLAGNVSTSTVKLGPDTFTTSTVTYSHSGSSQRFTTATHQLNGATSATETYRSATGTGAESGSAWSLEKIVYPGGFQQTSRPTWSSGALTLVSKSGWTTNMKTGSETTTILNRFGGLETGTSYTSKARMIPTVGGGEADVDVDKAVVTAKTSFGAPKTMSDLRGRSTTIAYEETGANWGLQKVANSAGLPDAGVTSYDWLGRATAIDGGHESFTVILETS